MATQESSQDRGWRMAVERPEAESIQMADDWALAKRFNAVMEELSAYRTAEEIQLLVSEKLGWMKEDNETFAKAS